MNSDNILLNTKIGFIGLGNMATALIKSLINKDILPSKIYGSDRSDERVILLKNELDIHATSDNNKVIKNSDIIFLCIKPQGISEFKRSLTSEIKAELKSKIIVSILAGVKLGQLSEVFETKNIIRLMPNINCQVGMVAGGYSVTNDTSDDDEELFKKIANCFGVIKKIPESDMDSLTAVSGSGPAFVAHIVKSFYDAGTELGLDEEIVKDLVNETFIGTVEMLKSGYDAENLIKIISSPNGTTFAGREILENSDISEVIKQTLKAAKDRSIEMGK